MRLTAGIGAVVTSVVMTAACSGFRDTVEVTGVATELPSTVVVRGRRSACFEYQASWGPIASFRNIRSAGGCPTGVVAFGESRAMREINEGVAFTDAAGDRIPIPMTDHFV